MCLAVVALNAHPRFRLVVAANRDEVHGRGGEEPPGQELHHGPLELAHRFGDVKNGAHAPLGPQRKVEELVH